MTNVVVEQLDWDVFLGNRWRVLDVTGTNVYLRVVDLKNDLAATAWCGLDDGVLFQELFEKNVVD